MSRDAVGVQARVGQHYPVRDNPTGPCEYRECDTLAETTIFYHTPPETVDYCAEHGEEMEDRDDATRII
jgi:hypothetical protein